jgi:hypothetical protein
MTWRRDVDTRDQPPLLPWLSRWPLGSWQWWLAWMLTGLVVGPAIVLLSYVLPWVGGLVLSL